MDRDPVSGHGMTFFLQKPAKFVYKRSPKVERNYLKKVFNTSSWQKFVALNAFEMFFKFKRGNTIFDAE